MGAFTYDIKSATGRATVLKVQAVTGTINGPAVDLRPYRGKPMLVMNAAAATVGTTPTLDVKIQESADGSTGWTDISGATFTQVTTTDSLQAIAIDTENTKAFIRAVTTIGGTSSPSFPVGITLVAFPQRV